MEYEGTFLDYVKHTVYNDINQNHYAIRTLNMPQNQSYTFYLPCDGVATAKNGFLTWTLTAPDAMFRFREFSTVGDLLDTLTEYLVDNPVFAWEELAGELADASVVSGINTALGAGAWIVKGSSGTSYPAVRTAFAAPTTFADAAAWLSAVCAGTFKNADISLIEREDETYRVYRITVSGTSDLVITLKLYPYIEPTYNNGSDQPDLFYNDDAEMYYASWEDCVDDAESGDTLLLLRDLTVEDMELPTGLTLYVMCDSNSSGANAHSRLHGGAAYVTLTVTGELTVNGNLYVEGYQQAWWVYSGNRYGNYGAMKVEGAVTVNGRIYLNGLVYGSGAISAAAGSYLYCPMAIDDWRGGNATYSAYNSYKIWPFNRIAFKTLRCTVDVAYGARLYANMLLYASNTMESLSAQFISTTGLFVLSSGTIAIEPTDAGNQIVVYGAAAMNSMSMTISNFLYSYVFSTKDTVFPFSDRLTLAVGDGGTLTMRYNAKFLPGGGIAVKNGGTLIVNKVTELFFYRAAEYSDTYFQHYTYDPDIPASDAALTVETGGTLTVQSAASGSADLTMTQTSTSSSSNNYYSWTRGTNTASVRGTRTSTSKSGFSQTLTLTATDDGIVSFSFNRPDYVTLVIDGTTYTKAGTFQKKMRSGEALTARVTFTTGTSSYRTVTLSNITQDLAGAGVVASSDSGLSNIPHEAAYSDTKTVQEFVQTDSTGAATDVTFYAE